MHASWIGGALRLCLAVTLALPVWAQAPAGGAASGSFRGAQDAGFDLSLRPVDLLNANPGSAPPGSFRAAQDAGSAWVQRYDDRWATEGYQGPGAAQPWVGGREQPLPSGASRF